jgi:hypothetical protein
MSNEVRENFKLQPGEKFISTSLLNSILKTSDHKKAVVEESDSELWYETLNGPGTLTFKNKVKYTGNIKYGILTNTDPSQPCTIIFPNGTIYTGTMKDNEITGTGTYTFSDGSTYTGSLVNGLRDGPGVYNSKDGIVYDGEWKKGLKNGKGKLTQGNMILEGEWVNGIISGKGRIKWTSGNFYDGEMNDNKIEGDGYMVWYNKNEKYTGQWKNNLQNGFGIHIWYEPKGEQKFLRDRYVGQWLCGVREGYGKFYYSNGSIYEGYWRNNKKEGFGVLMNADRTYYIGTFKEDRQVDNKALAEYNRLKELEKMPKEEKKKEPVENNKNSRAKSRKTTKIGTINNTSNANVAKKTSTKELNTISENNNDGDNEEKKEKLKEKTIQDKKTKISKSIDEIKIHIDLSDLIEIEPEIKNSLKELDNLLLRNLSLITHMYLVACGRENLRDAELGITTASISETKSIFNNQLISQKGSIVNNKEPNMETINNEEQKKKEEEPINYDCIYNNEQYFCLDLLGFWKLMRKCGLISVDFNLASIDRLFYENYPNRISMFYVPENLFLKEKDEPKRIYDYLYQSIAKEKNNFDIQYKTQMDQSNVLLFGSTNPPNNVPPYEGKENFEINFDYHNSKNIILMRHFYELLIRVAYLKYFNNFDMTIEQKVKTLFTLFKTVYKGKRKSLDSSLGSIMIIDPKLKNFDAEFDRFMSLHKKDLAEIFNDIYIAEIEFKSRYKNYDKTITYKFLYDNIILKNKILAEVFSNKIEFLELITIYHKEKIVTSSNANTVDFSSIEIINYIESVFNQEMVLYEFCELMFFISRKYFSYYEIKTERGEKNWGEDESDYYQEVMDIFYEISDKLLEKIRNDGMNKFFYPKLKTHILIEKIMEEEELKRLEEERRLKEIERYEMERKNLKNEDVNAYQEEEEKNESASDSYSDY